MIRTNLWRRLGGSGKIQCFVLRSAPDPLMAGLVLPFYHYFKNTSYLLAVIDSLNLALAIHKYGKPLCFLLIHDAVNHANRRSMRARRIFESKHAVVLHFIEQCNGLLKIGVGLAGETNNNVRRKTDGTLGFFNPADALEVFLASVQAHHGLERL